MKLNPTALELLILIQFWWLTWFHIRYHKRLLRWWGEWRKQRRGLRQLRVRDPSACPRCVHDIGWLERIPHPDVTPWHQVKRQSGRPKTSQTHGYACLNAQCDYSGSPTLLVTRW